MTTRQGTVAAIFFLLFGAEVSLAQDSPKEPFEKWNRNQINQLINDSPWAHNQTLSTAMGSGSGVQGEKEIFNKFTVRFFSALPIREAYVRMMQIVNKYDEMIPEQRAEFDTRFKRALNLDVRDRVIVALEFASNDPEAIREMKHFLEISKAETLKQNAYLISQHLGRVELREYFPPSSDGTGAKFVFPRSVNGKQLIEPGDKEVRFEFNVPLVDRRGGGSSQKVLIAFKVPQMSYKGELSF